MTSVFVITLGDIIGMTVVAIAVAAYLCVIGHERWNQNRCKHDKGIYETSACDAVCRKCGKNLGSIDAWRKNNNGIKGEA